MGESKLTPEILATLKTGDKVEFKWYGSDNVYVGRIELDTYGEAYFVAEHNYSGDELIVKSMKYYNSLESFFNFTYFKILNEK